MPIVDRRDFLKFAIGGAVGTLFSPLPWVPMDEVAKWSQRWSPIPEKGGTSYLNSTCKLCPGNCGIRVRLIEKKRAIKIEGHPNHPVNRGGLCPLGLAGLQYLYHEDIRVKQPLKRVGARGKGEWKPLSWEEALGELTAHLKELRQNNLSHTLALLDGQGSGSQALLMSRFVKAYGSPNVVRPYQQADLEESLTQTMHGFRAGLAYDLPRAQYLLSFGSALLDGWGTPTWVAQAYQEWRKTPAQGRAKLVQIDSLASTTASLADEWFAIKPGTEGHLALGLAQVMIEKGWYNKEYVQGRTSGLDSLQEVLKEYTPEKVSHLTGLSKEAILKISRDFTSAKQPLAVWGKGKGELPGSLFEAAAVHTLNLLAGSINKSGGVYLQEGFSPATWPKLGLDSLAEKGLAQARLDGAFSQKYPLSGQLLNQFFAKAAQKTPYPVNILLINEANPAFSLTGGHFEQALEQIPYLVSFSSLMDETTALADLILPAPTFLERWDDGYNSRGVPFPVYGITKPVLPPLHQTRPAGEVFIALAKALGGSVQEALPFESMEAVVKQAAKGVYEMKKGRLTDGPLPEAGKYSSASFESFDKFWEQLVAQGTWYHLEDKGEAGKTKAAFPAGVFLAGQNKSVQAHGESPEESPLLLVPSSLMLLQAGYWANPPFLTKYLGEETLTRNDLVAQIHPETAKSLSLREGEVVEIQSARGKAKVRIALFEGAMPKVIFAALGLGHQAFDPTLKNRGANLYPILDTTVDPMTGLEVPRPTRVKIKKA